MIVAGLSIRLSAIQVFMSLRYSCSLTNWCVAVGITMVFRSRNFQFFEYESISVHCEKDNSITEWSIKWKSHKITNSSYTSTSPSTIFPIFERHSGEYWCENEKGERSETVNITVTVGSVILETPTHPVMEGNEVILNCKNKNTHSMNIKNISKSDEGLYKCSIDGAGESPESWLTVLKESEGSPYTVTDFSQSLFPETLNLLWTVICVLLVDLLLLVVGLLLQNKCKVSACFSLVQGACSCEDNTEHTETVIYSSLN
ncbi:hypothetical protein ACER0C_009658 [Sarotherodon galilaeus]